MKCQIYFAVIVLLIASCNAPQKKSSSEETAGATNDQQILQMLKEAYEYAYPLVVMDATRRVSTNVEKPLNSGRILAPMNQLVNANQFPDDKFRDVVRPNCDTYYSIAWIDLSQDAFVLEIPNTGDRYFLFPMLDAWTNVFFSPGKRTTGTQAQTYLITGPKWKGEVQEGMQQVKAPTNTVWLVGRTQVNSAKDGATVVKKIQDGYKLLPLNVYGKSYSAPVGKIDPTIPRKTPNDVVTAMSVSDYFNLVNKLMVDNPPPSDDSVMLQKLASLGIAPGANFDSSKFSPAVQDSLKSIPGWAKSDMLQYGLNKGKKVNGWSISNGLGDYGTNYRMRAGIAYGGLGANLDADAMYPSSRVDADGESYDGSKQQYVLHFDDGKLPPANAFWSLTMYDKDGFLCANAVNRFAIGNRNDLKKNKDGSIDIYIQKDNPGIEKETNWLPAPDGTIQFSHANLLAERRNDQWVVEPTSGEEAILIFNLLVSCVHHSIISRRNIV
jgi:DNA sulfur modification protein DndE